MYEKLQLFTYTDYYLVVLSMSEMTVAIMVVSLPSMRAYIRHGGIFASKRTYGSSSTQHPSHRTPFSRSEHLKLSSCGRSEYRAGTHADKEESGSEVELEKFGRNDVIYETRRISVQFSDPLNDTHELARKVS